MTGRRALPAWRPYISFTAAAIRVPRHVGPNRRPPEAGDLYVTDQDQERER